METATNIRGVGLPRRSYGILSNILNVIAAAWLLVLAFVILYDVLGRALFNSPFLGAREILGNSVVAILFLQVPLAIHRGNMLRTTLIYDLLGQSSKRVIDIVTFLLGMGFFIAVGIGGWADMITGWRIREFEGIGALEIPVYPLRSMTVFLSFFAAIAYALLVAEQIYDWVHGTDSATGRAGGNPFRSAD